MKKNHVVISRAHFLAMIFASFVVLFATSFLAYAYGTTVPTAFGHSGGEVNVNCPIGNPSLIDVDTCLSRVNSAIPTSGSGAGTVVAGRTASCSTGIPFTYWGGASASGCPSSSTLRTTGILHCPFGSGGCSFSGGCDYSYYFCVRN